MGLIDYGRDICPFLRKSSPALRGLLRAYMIYGTRHTGELNATLVSEATHVRDGHWRHRIHRQ